MINRTVKRKGVTLVELVLVLALISLVLSGIFSMFTFGNSTFKGGSDQYDLQSDIRFALESLTNDLRYATRLEIISNAEIPENQFDIGPYETYIFYDSNIESVTKLTKNARTDYMVKSDADKVISFSKASEDRLYYKLDGVYDVSGNKFDVESEILLLNIMTPTGSSGIVDDSGYLDSGIGDAIRYTSPASYISEMQFPVIELSGVNDSTTINLSFDKSILVESYTVDPGANNDQITNGNISLSGSGPMTQLTISFVKIGNKPISFVDGDTINLKLNYGENNEYDAYYRLIYVGNVNNGIWRIE